MSDTNGDGSSGSNVTISPAHSLAAVGPGLLLREYVDILADIPVFRAMVSCANAYIIANIQYLLPISATNGGCSSRYSTITRFPCLADKSLGFFGALVGWPLSRFKGGMGDTLN